MQGSVTNPSPSAKGTHVCSATPGTPYDQHHRRRAARYGPLNCKALASIPWTMTQWRLAVEKKQRKPTCAA
eukprot:4029086-Amphidinium_carterae.1